MIEVRRQGRSGNLLETSGPVLSVEFGDSIVAAIFRGQRITHRYMELRRFLAGFAPEDKFHIAPVKLEEVERGVKKHIDIWTDPGGDITLELSPEAGIGHTFADAKSTFAIIDISNQPEGLVSRGIDTLYLPSLFAIERERQARLNWGLSNVDPDWRPGIL